MKIVPPPTIKESYYNVDKGTGSLIIYGTYFQADAASAISLSNITVEYITPGQTGPTIYNTYTGNVVDHEIMVFFDSAGLIHCKGVLRADVSLYGKTWTQIALGTVADPNPVVTANATHITPVNTRKMFVTGDGFNKHCKVHLINTDSNGKAPTDVQVMDWVTNEDKVTYQFLPVSVDLLLTENVGPIKASVKCPYHGDTADAPVWRTSNSPSLQITEVKANDGIPGASNLVISAAQRSTQFITLPCNTGYSSYSGGYVAKIISMPSAGTLHALHSQYREQGTTPYRGTEHTNCTNSTPCTVTVTKYDGVTKVHEVIWEAPIYFADVDFKYICYADDGVSHSMAAWVVIHSATSSGPVYSKFTINTEDWKAGPPGYLSTTNVVHSPSSIGQKISMYVHSNGGASVVGMNVATGRWFFESPGKFMVDNTLAYNGKLKISLMGLSGAFDTKLRSDPYSLVCLMCDACDLGNGIKLCQRNNAWTGNARMFEWDLHEKAGWLQDPNDSRRPVWLEVTQCQFLEVLAYMNAIHVYGDATTGTEAVALDDVILTWGDMNIYEPQACHGNYTTLSVFQY